MNLAVSVRDKYWTKRISSSIFSRQLRFKLFQRLGVSISYGVPLIIEEFCSSEDTNEVQPVASVRSFQ